jgi:hypothetical protein
MIDQAITQHEVARMAWLRDNDDDEIRLRTGDVMANAVIALSTAHRQFPALMKDEMEFSQLTSGKNPAQA